MRIKPTRLRKIHEAGGSGWGYTSPAGFTKDPTQKGIWRAGNALIRVTNAHSSKECLPICAGKILTVGQLKRSTASGKRTFTFKCNERISLGVDPGSPWQNGYVENFNGKFRDECLDQEMFYSRGEAQVIADRYMNRYNRVRSHSSLGYLTPEVYAQTATQTG